MLGSYKLNQQSFDCLRDILEFYCSEKGYDAGFLRNEYGCIFDRCECAHFSQTVMGKIIRSFSLTNEIIQVISLYQKILLKK